MTQPPSNFLEELRIKRPIYDSQKGQSEGLFQKHKNERNETVFKTQGTGPMLKCVSLSVTASEIEKIDGYSSIIKTDFDTKIEILDGKKISSTVKVETPVKIFRTIDEGKDSASLEQQYTFAEEGITNPLTKLFNSISGNDEENIELNSGIIKQTKSQESNLEHDDFESSEINTRSIPRLILKRRQLEEKKAAKSVSQTEEILFMMENIYNPLKRVHPRDTIDFYEHLLPINPDPKTWTSQFVEQEYANFFNVAIPGDEIGGVSVWGKAVDILISGSSTVIGVGTSLASTSGFSASTAEAAGASGLSQSILVAPVTSAVTAISAAGASAIPVTEALAATATAGGFSALMSIISALAATPATAPMAASAFSSVAALVGAGAMLFALNKAKGRYPASLPETSGEKHLALLMVEEDDETIRLDPIPQSFSQEMDDSIGFMKDVQFLSENPESVSYREKLDILHRKAKIVKKLSLDSFVPDEKNDDETVPSSAIVEATTLPTDFPLQNNDDVNISKPTIVDTITSVESQNLSSQHQELTPPQQSSEDSTQILQPYHNHSQLCLSPEQQLIQHPSQPQQHVLQSSHPEPGVSVYEIRVVGLIVKNNKRGKEI
ncbi:hypothetical protein BDK51DRAFT_41033 [Blyttiomyces helicus]|uniref:Uncharacterized protein n=1 Tax=Blyttiomyces helicus TaxID=388810 RepID=A0A4P9WNE9_9FUNG|nr:hypothetical protein BDK51DRAFT_41033 [Blyttiomyces helicus]|eukprot:RKO92286.1 hypothetical protein BDK51DRAFT_41033 [Blyttiomyces helicus]